MPLFHGWHLQAWTSSEEASRENYPACPWLASSGLVRLWGTRLGTLGSPPLQNRHAVLSSSLPQWVPQGHTGQGSLTSIFHGWHLQVQTGLGESVRGSRNTSPMDHLWKAGQALGSKAEVAVPPLPCLA